MLSTHVDGGSDHVVGCNVAGVQSTDQRGRIGRIERLARCNPKVQFPPSQQVAGTLASPNQICVPIHPEDTDRSLSCLAECMSEEETEVSLSASKLDHGGGNVTRGSEGSQQPREHALDLSELALGASRHPAVLRYEAEDGQQRPGAQNG
jgi:hypothetical protein